MSVEVEVDPKRVQQLILELGAIGAVDETGVTRLAYSPEWKEAAERVTSWFADADLSPRIDAVGNVWGRIEGTEPGPVIATGSHLDSQVLGGRYDGALGVIAGFVALDALQRAYGRPKHTLECVGFCEEESSRFAGAGYWGSRAIVGKATEEDAEQIVGFDAVTIADAMRSVGLDPARTAEARRDDIESFLELHIEQGPILEQQGQAVAVVDVITGIRQYIITLDGEQNHAGAFPMDLRRDPMAAFAEIAATAIDTAHRRGRPAVTTVGRVVTVPNGTAIIPSRVTFSLDVRHPDQDAFLELCRVQERIVTEIAERRGIRIEMTVGNHHDACAADAGLVDTLVRATHEIGSPSNRMHSGAGHDSQQMAEIAKMAMIFVRSKDGRSHAPEEFSSIEDIVVGIRVLAAALYELAY